MQLRNVNLNLLPVLQALIEERSVSDAADRLAMSQSAASEALGKLRVALDDPLLVRSGTRMELTPRAAAMRAPLDEICRALGSFLQRPEFDAAAAERTFVIASVDYGINRIARRLIAMLRYQAPGVTIRFIYGGGEEALTGLRERETDFAIIPQFFVDDGSPENLLYRELFKDHAVAVFDRDHPLAERDAIDHADLDAYRMIAFHPGSSRIERRHLNAFSGGKPFRVAAFVPDVLMVPHLIRGSGDFGIIPADFRSGVNAFPDIVDRELTFFNPELSVGLAWSSVNDADAGHRWLRDLICNHCADEVV